MAINRQENNIKRCPWCGIDPVYVAYHDNEWGCSVKDDRALFEFLVLEGAQAGLSWLTILKKREAYRKAFAGFDPVKVARFNEHDIEELLLNTGIVRNKLKISSAISNARLFIEVCEEHGSFFSYLMNYFPEGFPVVNDITDSATAPCRSDISDAISKDLKKRGFTFFGSVICYSFLQATGFIDDHQNDCSFKNKPG